MRLGSTYPSGTGLAPGSIRETLNFRAPFFGAANGGDLVLRLTPSDGPGTYNLWLNAVDNPGDVTRKDQCMNLGYNIARGGGVENSSDAGVGDFWESHWDDGGGFVRVERHIAFVTAASVQTRFITAQMRTDTSRVDVAFNSTSFTFHTQGTQDGWLQFSSQAISFGTTSNGLQFNRNNVSQITQLNAASNGYLSLAHIDSSDRVVLGGATQPVKMSGSLVWRGYTTSTAAPTATQLPANKDCCVHEDTQAAKAYFAYNLNGSIKKVELT